MNHETPTVVEVKTKEDAMKVMLQMLKDLDESRAKMGRAQWFVKIGDTTPAALSSALQLINEHTALENRTIGELTRITEQFGIKRQEVLDAYEAA